MVSPNQQHEDFVSDIYDGYQDTQKEIFGIECRKARVKLFTIAFVIFLFDFIAIARLGAVTPNSVLIISIIPLLITGLGILSIKEPMIAMIIALLIIAGFVIFIICNFIMNGQIIFTIDQHFRIQK